MKRTILLGTLAATLLAPFAASEAHSSVSIGVSTPEFGIRIGGPVFHPGPFHAPAPVIVAPLRYAPRHFGPRAGVWVAPRAHHHHRGWNDRRDWRRGDRDGDGYRAGYRH
jgi:hypothetical protein